MCVLWLPLLLRCTSLTGHPPVSRCRLILLPEDLMVQNRRTNMLRLKYFANFSLIFARWLSTLLLLFLLLLLGFAMHRQCLPVGNNKYLNVFN